MVKKSGRDKPGQPRGWRPEEADRRRPRPPEGAAPRPRRVARAEAGPAPDRATAAETEALTILHGRQVLYGFHTVAAALAKWGSHAVDDFVAFPDSDEYGAAIFQMVRTSMRAYERQPNSPTRLSPSFPLRPAPRRQTRRSRRRQGRWAEGGSRVGPRRPAP